jgi:hypothetical protein
MDERTENKIIIFKSSDGKTEVDVSFDGDTVWLTQTQIAKLFGTSRTNAVEHIDHIYREEELARRATCRKFRQVQTEGNRQVERSVAHYNLDLIISVGYRINSRQATGFRQWATDLLRRHLLDGYTVNQRRLEQLKKTVRLLEKSADPTILGISSVLDLYHTGLKRLDDYDHQIISDPIGDGEIGG